MRLGPRVQNSQARGLFSKMAAEGVSSVRGRWMTIGRLRSDLGGVGWPPRQNRSGRGGFSIAGVKLLAGVHQNDAAVHQKQNRRHWSEEKEVASSPRAFSRPERARRSVAASEGREEVGEIQNSARRLLGLSLAA